MEFRLGKWFVQIRWPIWVGEYIEYSPGDFLDPKWEKAAIADPPLIEFEGGTYYMRYEGYEEPQP